MMTWYPTVVGILVLAVYAWRLLQTVRMSGSAVPSDRVALLALVAEGLLVLLVARVLVDWTIVPGWLWVMASVVVLAGAGAVLALRWAALPWLDASTPGRRVLRGAMMVPFAAVLLFAATYLALSFS